MAKYEVYAEYKDSGVEWLGEIPSHWKITALKRYCAVKGGYAFSSDIFSSVGAPVIRIGDIKTDGSISLESCKFIPTELAKSSQAYLVEKGQLLMAMTGATIGKAGVYVNDSPAYLNQRVGKFVIDNNELNYNFLWYTLKTNGYQEYIKLTAFGGAQPNISDTGMVDYISCFPSIIEQTQIANFLDHETAQINSLIEKQQQLIQLLKEKRQAGISHAVTKGLNPNVPMKDSGVEWLGAMPEHWTLSNLKYFASIQGGYAFNSDLFVEEGTQVLRIGNVYQNTLSLDRQPTYISNELVKNFKNFIVSKNDVLMSLTGTLGKRDYGFAIKVKTDENYLLNQRVAKISPNHSKIDTDFMVYVLWSESYLTQLYSLPSGTKQANLSNSDVLGIQIVIPPSLEEQQAIAKYLENKLLKFDDMILKAESAIQLMQERRTALISAAVTGKIDVRNWQNPNNNNEAKTEFSA